MPIVVKAPNRALIKPSDEALIAQTETVFGNPSLRRPLLSVAQAASYIGMSQSWLRKSRVYGNGPTATVLGRRVHYDLRDLETWLATRKQVSTSADELWPKVGDGMRG